MLTDFVIDYLSDFEVHNLAMFKCYDVSITGSIMVLLVSSSIYAYNA